MADRVRRISNTLRPELAGHEQPLPRGVPGNAVQHRGSRPTPRRAEAGEIDPRGHRARAGIDDRDPIRQPHVGVHGAVHDLEFVEVIDGTVGVVHGDAARLAQRLGIEEPQGRRAVAEDQPVAVLREPPALALVVEPAARLERRTVVDEAHARLPRELDQPVPPVRRGPRRSSGARPRAAATSPVSGTTLRTLDWPLRPVLS